MTTRVAIVGGTGRLGSVIRAVVDADERFELAALLGSGSDLDELANADVVVDATTPAVSSDVVRAAIAHGKNLVVGTSGWSGERIAQVRPLVDAAGTGILFVPNFSLGSVVGSALAAASASLFDSIEIVEAHHDGKVDSPSGTAVRTAELIAAARESVGPVAAPHVDQRARGQQVASVPIHSLRRPGVIARQEVVLSGPGESLTIVHDTVDPARAYDPGIRLALRAAPGVRGVVVGLDRFLDLGLRLPADRDGEQVDDGDAGGQVARATGA